jgi:hypothetical protein
MPGAGDDGGRADDGGSTDRGAPVGGGERDTPDVSGGGATGADLELATGRTAPSRSSRETDRPGGSSVRGS